MLWGDNPTIDLPGAVLEYVSPPKKALGTIPAGEGPGVRDEKGKSGGEEKGIKGGERRSRAGTEVKGARGDVNRDGVRSSGRWERGDGGNEIERGFEGTGGRESRHGGFFRGTESRNGGRDSRGGRRLSRLGERDAGEGVGFAGRMTPAGEGGRRGLGSGRGTPGPDSRLFQRGDDLLRERRTMASPAPGF